MAEDVPPSTQAAAAAAAPASARGEILECQVGVLFVCLFSVCLKQHPSAVLFRFRRRVATVSSPACTQRSERPPPKHVDTSRGGHVIIIPGLKVD